MALLLGLDTGGTCTDAAIVDEASRRVVAKAKALTTHGDLAMGLGEAASAALAAGGVAPGDIAMASLSTTLATNALVEGRGARVALAAIGFEVRDLERGGVVDALGGAPLLRVAGGRRPNGDAAAPFDAEALERAAADIAGEVDAFAVAGLFAVRNPADEIAARDVLRRVAGLPVTCSHELSPRIGGPKRALTAVLNARLIDLLDRLVAATGGMLRDLGVAAPLMVVRGDGSLVAADFARERPIETILSGPAASLVGAGWLTGRADALVSDIGGTTTDIALLSGGRPRIDPEGARVGGWRTMVEAVAMATHGLGGDSEIRLEPGLAGALRLGPRRATPLSLLAMGAPSVRAALDAQLADPIPRETDGRFAARAEPGAGADAQERALLAALDAGPLPMAEIAADRRAEAALRRLAARGLARIAAFTPTDAAHVLGACGTWDRGAAVAGAALLARSRTGGGTRLAADADAAAELTLAALARRSAEAVLDAAFAEDGYEAPELGRSPLAAAALDGRAGVVRPRMELSVPLIALGASAATHYPAVGRLLGAELVTPEHADVANAVGAVVGGVRIERRIAVTRPQDGLIRVHGPDGAQDFGRETAAFAAAETLAADLARRGAAEAGARDAGVTLSRNRRAATIEGRDMLIEGEVVAVAAGRPAAARG